jgi:hypothetical protein
MTRRSETRIPPASSAIGVKSLESSPKPLQAYGGASLLRECTFLHKKTECFRQRNQSPHKRAGMMSITEQFTLTTQSKDAQEGAAMRAQEAEELV